MMDSQYTEDIGQILMGERSPLLPCIHEGSQHSDMQSINCPSEPGRAKRIIVCLVHDVCCRTLYLGTILSLLMSLYVYWTLLNFCYIY